MRPHRQDFRHILYVYPRLYNRWRCLILHDKLRIGGAQQYLGSAEEQLAYLDVGLVGSHLFRYLFFS